MACTPLFHVRSYHQYIDFYTLILTYRNQRKLTLWMSNRLYTCLRINSTLKFPMWRSRMLQVQACYNASISRCDCYAVYAAPQNWTLTALPKDRLGDRSSI